MPPAVTAVIAEDEPLLQQELAEALAKLWPELAIVGLADNGIDALRLLSLHHPTILFLDIQMPGLTGLDVAKQSARSAHVVFVTACDQHAIAAFEEGAVDYVMKPVSLARLASTVQRLKEKAAEPPADLSKLLASLALRQRESRSYLRWINASVDAAIKLITVDEICYVKVDGGGVRAITATSEAQVRKSIAELAEDLDPEVFVPITPATLVNVNAIAGVARDARGRLQVRFKQRAETLDVDDAYASVVAEAAGLIGGARGARDDGRQLATVLFTDIVDSTAAASRLGDFAWHELLREHDRVCRRAIEQFHGRWINSTGDGVFATFDGPARAIRCASAIGESMRGLGIALRAGVHTGECEVHGGDVRGLAV
ncbi:MAG: response regulator, partial [Casimicrobiaceae bacterium]